MENKYLEFLEVVKRIEDNRLKENCNSLVTAVQLYYSYQQWYEQLKPINSVLSAYSGKDINKISITDNYIMLMCYEYVRKADDIEETYKFPQFLNEYIYSDAWRDNRKEYLLFKEHKELKNIKYSKIICNSINKFRKLKKHTDFDSNYATTRHNNLEKAVNIYINNKNVTILDKETAFNAIYSDRLVTDISLCIEKDIFTVDFFIAPIRRVLSTSEGKNNRYSEYFDRRIERSYEELKSKCDDIITKYSKSMNNIIILNKWFEKLENEI